MKKKRFDSDRGMLIVLCTICSTPLGISKEIEADLLQAVSISCPQCKQKSEVTKELKQFIVYF